MNKNETKQPTIYNYKSHVNMAAFSLKSQEILVFLDCGWLKITETMESETVDKERLCKYNTVIKALTLQRQHYSQQLLHYCPHC